MGRAQRIFRAVKILGNIYDDIMHIMSKNIE